MKRRKFFTVIASWCVGVGTAVGMRWNTKLDSAPVLDWFVPDEWGVFNIFQHTRNRDLEKSVLSDAMNELDTLTTLDAKYKNPDREAFQNAVSDRTTQYYSDWRDIE